MAASALTTAATLQCPHGGQVVITSSNTQVTADGIPLVTAMDTYVIAGCPFTIPSVPPIPSPCVTVQWMAPNPRVKVNSIPTLDQNSVGMCLSAAQVPQGPVQITPGQEEVGDQ